jgi:hypothetical protein
MNRSVPLASMVSIPFWVLIGMGFIRHEYRFMWSALLWLVAWMFLLTTATLVSQAWARMKG